MMVDLAFKGTQCIGRLHESRVFPPVSPAGTGRIHVRQSTNEHRRKQQSTVPVCSSDRRPSTRSNHASTAKRTGRIPSWKVFAPWMRRTTQLRGVTRS